MKTRSTNTQHPLPLSRRLTTAATAMLKQPSVDLKTKREGYVAVVDMRNVRTASS